MIEEIKKLVGDSLQLGDRIDELKEDTELLGNFPELDSMAVVTILTAIEDYYGFTIDDDEIDAETFLSLGSLVSFVESKINS